MPEESKIVTELSLSLSIPEETRKNSLDLNEGFYTEYNEWELIIRYFGPIEDISKDIPFSYIELLLGYAVIRIAEENIEKLSENPQIIFIEKPKAVYFENSLNSQDNIPGNLAGYNAACFNFINTNYNTLKGNGVLVAVIDSGVDFMHPLFVKDGKTNIYEIWDQSIDGNPPFDLKIGSVYDSEDINNAIAENNRSIAYDGTGHGTAVLSIIKRLVPDAKLLVVKLSEDYTQSFSRTTRVMLGITYAIKKSIELRLPVVINLSYGNNYGDHDSGSMLEWYIDDTAGISKTSIITGMGNEGSTSRHTEFNISDKTWHQEEFLVSRFEKAINIQIWRKFADKMDIMLITPDGAILGPFNQNLNTMKFTINNMDIFVINGYPTPFSRNQETYISIIPKGDYIQEGIWKLMFNPKNIVEGRVNIWLPVSASTSSELRFLKPSEFTTMTIPSSSKKAISVGAYDQNNLNYAAFSGRGYTTGGDIKPDISAPGVDINVASPDGGYVNVTGTSFSTPFVSAAAAILMEYGITNGNDTFLYGEKLKEYLINGAKKLPGSDSIPNEKIGWGVLCVSDSLP